MNVHRGFRDLGYGGAAPAVTIGNFDGVHRGHQQVILSARRDAEERGVDCVVCTFDPHTRAVLRPEEAPPLLQTPGQRLASLEALGVGVAVVIPFDREIASTSHEAFVEEFLLRELRVGGLHVSKGFAFGRSSAGSADYLEEAGRRHGFRVHRLEPLLVDGEPVSSTRIRELLAAGRVAEATRLLGRPFSVVGEVVRGAGRGRSLDAPTANLEVANGVIPAAGVYVTEARFGGHRYPAVTNVGHRPTFEDDTEDLIVETHLLGDEQRDLYGVRLELAFLRRLRGERRFPDAEALAAQIREDVREAESWFASAGGPHRVPDA